MVKAKPSRALTPDHDLRESAHELALFLSECGMPVELARPDGERVRLPEPVYRMLVDVARALDEGKPVSVLVTATELTTQEAADLLNVSRPYLIRLLDAGELPYRRVGTHRRVGLADVLRYKDERSRRRKQALGELANEAESLGRYQA